MTAVQKKLNEQQHAQVAVPATQMTAEGHRGFAETRTPDPGGNGLLHPISPNTGILRGREFPPRQPPSPAP